MVEPDRQQPLSGHMLVPAVAAARPDVGVQVCDRLGDAGVVGVQHRPPGDGVTEAVQDGDALGGSQHHVEGGHGAVAVRSAEELAGVGVAALEHAPEALDRCFAFQPEQRRAVAVPAAWGLAVGGQVLFVVAGEFAGVVVSRPTASFAMSATTCCCLLAAVDASKRTRGALLSSDDFGSRVERAVWVQVLWRALAEADVRNPRRAFSEEGKVLLPVPHEDPCRVLAREALFGCGDMS